MTLVLNLNSWCLLVVLLNVCLCLPCLGLGEALVIGACFLSIVRLPPLAMSAPASPPSTSSGDPHGGGPGQIHQQRMKWVNPCGLPSNEDLETEMDSVSQPTLTDQTLLEQIVVQAKNALMHAEIFRSDYVSKSHHPNSFISFINNDDSCDEEFQDTLLPFD